MNENLGKVCRVCLAEGSRKIFEKNQIFEENYMNVSSLNRILEKLRFVTLLKIDEHENLPPLICDLCIVQLNVAYNFKRQATDSDAKIRQYLIENGISLRKDTHMLTAPPTVVHSQIRNGSISSSSVYELSTATTRDIQTPQSTIFPQIRPISVKIETPEISDTQSTISPLSSSTNHRDLPPIIVTPSEADAMIGVINNNNNEKDSKDSETSGSELNLNATSTNSSGSEVMVTVPNAFEHEFLRPIDPPPKVVENLNEILVHPAEIEKKDEENETNQKQPGVKRKLKKGMAALLESLKIDFALPQTPEDNSKLRKRNEKVNYRVTFSPTKTDETNRHAAGRRESLSSRRRNDEKEDDENLLSLIKKDETQNDEKPLKKIDSVKKNLAKKDNIKMNPVSIVIKRAKIPKSNEKSGSNRKEKMPSQRKKADALKTNQKNKLKFKLIKDKLMVKLKKQKEMRKDKNNKIKNIKKQKPQKNLKKQKRKD